LAAFFIMSKTLISTLAFFLCACAIADAQPMLVAGPVSGKLGLTPGKYFSEAIITPSTSTAYLSGTTGGVNATDIVGQTKTAMDGLNKTLTTLGSSMDAVVKTTIFMTNISDFASMNPVYVSYFTPNSTLPARSTVQVASLVGTTQIEIEFIVYDPKFASMKASA